MFVAEEPRNIKPLSDEFKRCIPFTYLCMAEEIDEVIGVDLVISGDVLQSEFLHVQIDDRDLHLELLCKKQPDDVAICLVQIKRIRIDDQINRIAFSTYGGMIHIDCDLSAQSLNERRDRRIMEDVFHPSGISESLMDVVRAYLKLREVMGDVIKLPILISRETVDDGFVKDSAIDSRLCHPHLMKDGKKSSDIEIFEQSEIEIDPVWSNQIGQDHLLIQALQLRFINLRLFVTVRL